MRRRTDTGGVDDIPLGRLESVPGFRHEPDQRRERNSASRSLPEVVVVVEQVRWGNRRAEAADLLRGFSSEMAARSFSRHPLRGEASAFVYRG